MVRIIISGGVWKNTEDEILKAAIMKYGKNQWSRISSLLVRKSAKQCKARWYEWLDPSIKKTEWTRQEEEKLLHLAKIMPTQWRTIAPIIGRTAAQCLEHYEKLLDAAQQKDADYDPADDPRRLRAGDIDPNPEGKPAQPDPVDMDEDEREMLSEARARLANTKGKKAKRKAREKQLQEARRLALLQKRRELKAAGINMKRYKRRKKNQIDYNEEIPFERRPQAGFYDTHNEIKRSYEEKTDKRFLKMNMKELDGERRDEIEARERKKDARRLRLHRKNDLPAAIQAVNKLNDPDQIRRRGTMALPTPQVSDNELNEISKLGNAQSQVAGSGLTKGSTATRTLLSNYEAQKRLPTPSRTARTPQAADNILLETQNLIALTNAPTPLMGGANTPLHPTDFSGITPKRQELRTPSFLSGGATPRRMNTGARAAGRGGSTPAMTPVRDELQINSLDNMTAEEVLFANETRKSMRKRRRQMQSKLSQQLANLPKATNEYALVMPHIPDLKEQSLNDDQVTWEEDAEEAEERLRLDAAARKQAELNRRSTALKRGLPRPSSINPAMIALATTNKAQHLINQEALAMLKYDAIRYPATKKRKRNQEGRRPKRQKFSDATLNSARDLLEAEYESAGYPSMIKAMETSGDLQSSWISSYQDSLFLPNSKQYGLMSQSSKTERIQAKRQQLELVKEHITVEQARADKLQKRLNIVLGGYQKRSQSLSDKIIAANREAVESQTSLECFQALQAQEEIALPTRLKEIKEEVTKHAVIENTLQERYQRLTNEVARLKQLVGEA